MDYLLGCVSVPLSKRILIFKAAVDASVFWCAGSWNLTREQHERLRVFQMRLLRRMLRIKRADGENMGIFLHSANGILKDKLSNGVDNHETWGLRATQLRFDWGGHVARLQHLDPNRLTYRVFRHWNYEETVGNIEAYNQGRQGHNRHLHVWRWEYYM